MNDKVIIISCIVALVVWVVALGGTAALTDYCREAAGADACSDAYRYEWWGIWFTFFLVLVIIFAAVKGAVQSWAPTFQAFGAACLSVTMLDSHTHLDGPFDGNNGRNNGIDSKWADANDAAAAGFIMISIMLFVIIIALGMISSGTTVNVAMPTVRKSSGGNADKKVAPAPASEDKVEPV